MAPKKLAPKLAPLVNQPRDFKLSPEVTPLPFSPCPFLQFDQALLRAALSLPESSPFSPTSDCLSIEKSGSITKEDSPTSTPSSPAESSTSTLVSYGTISSATISSLHAADFHYVKLLGLGGSGQVHQVYHKSDDKQKLFALKVAPKSNNECNTKAKMMEELKTLKRVSGTDWVVGLEAAWSDTENFYFLMTLESGGDLFNELDDTADGFLHPLKCKFIFAEMYYALTHIHSLGVIHLDVKPENILRTNTGHYKLTDLGMSYTFDTVPKDALEYTFQPYLPWWMEDLKGPKPNDPKNSLPKRRNICELPFICHEKRGTLDYCAPEIYLDQPFSFPVDFWSLSIVLYCIITGRYPWSDKEAGGGRDPRIIAMHIIEDPLEFGDDDTNICQDGKVFLKKMLEKKPEDRLPIALIRENAFLRDLPWDQVESQKYVYAEPIEIQMLGLLKVLEDIDYKEVCNNTPFAVGKLDSVDVAESEFAYCSDTFGGNGFTQE